MCGCPQVQVSPTTEPSVFSLEIRVGRGGAKCVQIVLVRVANQCDLRNRMLDHTRTRDCRQPMLRVARLLGVVIRLARRCDCHHNSKAAELASEHERALLHAVLSGQVFKIRNYMATML